ARATGIGAGARCRAGPRRSVASVSRRRARPEALGPGCGEPRSAQPDAATQRVAGRSHRRWQHRLGLRGPHADACGRGKHMKVSRESFSVESLAALSARDQRVVLGTLGLAALVVIFGVLIPLDRSVAHAHDRLAKKRADLSWMQGVAPDLAPPAPAPAPPDE